MRPTTPQSRLSGRILRFVFLFLIASVVVFGSLRIAAQNPAEQPSAAAEQPSAAAAPSTPNKTNGLPAQPGQEKKEEQEEENVYRHTALVEKLAAIFHLDVETTARLFEIINFAIIALAIVIPLFKFVPRVIRQRRVTLSANLEAARKTTADANSRLTAVEAQLSRLDEEIAKIRTQVEVESRQDEARIKATIEEEGARIVSSAEQEIGVAAAQAKRELRHFAADLAIEQATRQLVLTPETDRALIAEFISETTRNGSTSSDGRGGRN